MDKKINISFDKASNTLLKYYQDYYKETTDGKVEVKKVAIDTYMYTPAYAEDFAGFEMDEMGLSVKLTVENKSDNFDTGVESEIPCSTEDALSILEDIYNQDLEKSNLQVSKINYKKDHLEVTTREYKKTNSI